MPSKAPHGSLSRYRYGCRCEPCSTASNEYSRAYWRDYQSRLVPRTDRSWAPMFPTARRLQGLCSIGYSAKSLSPLVGRHSTTIDRAMRGAAPYVLEGTAKAVRRVYEERSMVPRSCPDCPPLWQEPGAHYCGAVRARRWARAHGYAPPLAWNEGDIDIEAARPHGAGRSSPSEGFIENVEQWLNDGLRERAILGRAHISAVTFEQRLRRGGRPDLLRWARHGVHPDHQATVPYVVGSHGLAS